MKIIKYIIPAVILVFMTSCSERILDQDTTSDSILTLTFKSSSLSTKVAGVESLNENKIESLHYFIYSVVDFDETTSTPIVSGVETGLNAQGQYGIQINLTGPELNDEVFPRPNNTCKVYAIANLPSNVKLPDNPTIKDLRAIAIEANFANMPQESFVMEGLGEARIKDRKEQLAAEGTIEILRVAAKLSLNINVDESVESNGITYYSSPGTMKVQLVYGVKNAKIGASPVSEPQYSEFSYRNVITNNSGYSCDPFYTYPSSWEIGDEYEPYLRIIVPWYTKVGSAGSEDYTPAECYYKVILTGEEFKRNTWYDLTINLSVLGSFDPEEEKTIEVKDIVYYVANWSNGLNVETQIEGARYLIVEKDRYEIFNEEEFEIPIISSHKATIANISVTQIDLLNVDTPKVDNDHSISINNESTLISIFNDLDNNLYSETFNFTPITIKFTVFQDDDGDGVVDSNEIYRKDVEITQYPAVYGNLEVNSDYLDGGNTTDKHGYGYVNGYYGSPGNGINQEVEGFCNFAGKPSGSGVNSNSMFVITATSLEGTNWIIGDPRTTEIDQELVDRYNWADAKALYGNSPRELQYYYPAQSDLSLGANHPTYNMIAPKFRICSGYGAIDGNNTRRQYLDYMEGRCASYQEDGYPAGRWRLPTKAELEFVFVLCEKGLLPDLFADQAYWCAHGYGQYHTGQNFTPTASNDRGSTKVSVRCVYDEWYWGNSKFSRLEDKETFTWGDIPR